MQNHELRSAPRPGGRSARVQAAVHEAVQRLQARLGREALTIPAIATEAGVTPSTIYRRWGDLGQLLADVAVEQLRPDAPPDDTGDFRSDLRAWLGQYMEEMNSQPGRAMLRDVLGSGGTEGQAQCMHFCTLQIDALRQRALQRGQTVTATEQIIDQVVAPLIYRILFANTGPTDADLDGWLATALPDGAAIHGGR
ncbi:TetR/AcrR family transcriptional regulator [Frateuria aurantia]